MIELDNRTSLEVDFGFIQKIADFLTQKDIELVITGSKEMQDINLAHRNINKDTDVLSFPYDDMPMVPLGSIIISSEYVINKAKELGHSECDEFALLFIHGILHLLGYDHEVDNGEMRDEEERLIKKFNLPKSLIVRSQNDSTSRET